jgi:hypothetical protein
VLKIAQPFCLRLSGYCCFHKLVYSLFGEATSMIRSVVELKAPAVIGSSPGFSALMRMIASGMPCRLLHRTEMMTEGNRDRANALF